MNKINKMFQNAATVFMVVAIVSVGAITMPMAAHAQYAGDGGCCDTGSYYDTSTPDYSSYYDTSTPDYSSYYDTSTPDYSSYYDTSTPDYSSYYDTSTPDYSTYYDTSTPSYTDYGYAYDTGYTGYDYGYSASPVYSYSTPAYTSGGYYGGYSVAPHIYASPTPSYSYTTPTYTAPQPHITISPTTVGTPSGQQQQQQTQANTQTQNNPVTVTQNQAPITNTNNNVINVPAPVYQTPVQQLVQYTFPSNYQTPTCSISVSTGSYNSYNNQPVTLTWSSSNAYSATISPNVGSVNPNGSTTIYPTAGTTIYTMTVYGQGGNGTCQTQVVYQAQPTYPPANTYVPPAAHAPYVSLTQIPYTGFDFGPVGNAIYWISLLSFAIAAAYLVIYYKGGFALVMGTTERRANKHSMGRSIATERTAHIESPAITAPARSASFANLPTREYRNATSDAMTVAQAKNADEMPRIVITRS